MLPPVCVVTNIVITITLIQAVKRNIERFQEDFMFQLNPEEFANLKSQIGISSWGGARAASYAFTDPRLFRRLSFAWRLYNRLHLNLVGAILHRICNAKRLA